MWRFSFFSILAPQTRLLWSASKQPWNALQCVFSKSNHKTLFFLFVKTTVFRKRILMLLLLRKSITDVPVHRDWGTFGILCLSVGFTWGAKFSNISLTGPVESNTAGMGQVSNLWKKKWNGVIQEGKTIRNWRERQKGRMKSQEANEWKQRKW